MIWRKPFLRSSEAAPVLLELLDLAKNADHEIHRLLAVRAYVRLLGMAGYDDPVTATAGPTIVMEGKEAASISMAGFTVQNTSDAVLISHEGAALVRDCQGVQVAADTWVTNIYAIS